MINGVSRARLLMLVAPMMRGGHINDVSRARLLMLVAPMLQGGHINDVSRARLLMLVAPICCEAVILTMYLEQDF